MWCVQRKLAVLYYQDKFGLDQVKIGLSSFALAVSRHEIHNTVFIVVRASHL